MAEFSNEYIKRKGLEISPSFSIHLEFKKLKEGEIKHLKCEGFGFNAILKEDNTCKLVFNSNELKTYDELLLLEM